MSSNKDKIEKMDELIELLKNRDNADEVDNWILEVREMFNAWMED